MLINNDSPLRNLPSQLNRKQTLFLDAIRYSVEITDLSYTRLKKTLIEVVDNQKSGKEITNISLVCVNALSDAWSIIDSVNRLRNLLDQMPNLKKKSPGLINFNKQTRSVEDLRNIFQHLNQEIENIIKVNSNALGVINWIAPLDESTRKCYIESLQPGTIFGRGFPLINPAGKRILYPIDQITLVASDKSVCLSDVMIQIEKLTKSIEGGLRKQTGNLPKAGSDLLILLEWEASEDK